MARSNGHLLLGSEDRLMNMEQLIAYAMSFAGIRYRWSGDDPLGGFDCSGFACELAIAGGVLPHGTRMNSQSLYEFFSRNGVIAQKGPGAFAFFGKDQFNISHVAFCLDMETMLEAGGGDATTINEAEAIRRNAFVRMRPIAYRKDFVQFVRPRYRLTPS